MGNSQWNLLRRKGAEQDEVFIGPQSIGIHITNACALSCHFCPYHFCGDEKYGSVRRHFDLSIFQNIIDDCAALKVELVGFTGEGDPFSHPEIRRMIAYVKDKGIKLDVNTHGLFPMESMFPYVQLVDYLNVNLPGVDEASYKNSQFDKKDCFKKVTENVRFISQYKKGQRPLLNWVYLVTKDSFQYLSRVILLMDDLGFDTVTFILPVLHEGNDQIAIVAKYLEDLKKEIAVSLRIASGKKAKSNILEFARIVSSSVFYEEGKRDTHNNSRIKERLSIYYERAFPEKFSCLVGWRNAKVDLNGDVIFCGNLRTMVGNVYKEKFRDIWNGQNAKQMRLKMKYHFDLKKSFWNECKGCAHLPVEGIPSNRSLF